MSDLIITTKSCQQCGRELPDSDKFCGNCGVLAVMPCEPRPQVVLTNRSQQFPAYAAQLVIVPPTQVSVVDQALSNRLIVVAILLVAGPIGLPALWFSPSFSKRAKIVTSVAYFLLTAVLPLVALWYFLECSLRPLLNVFAG